MGENIDEVSLILQCRPIANRMGENIDEVSVVVCADLANPVQIVATAQVTIDEVRVVVGCRPSQPWVRTMMR